MIYQQNIDIGKDHFCHIWNIFKKIYVSDNKKTVTIMFSSVKPLTPQLIPGPHNLCSELEW